MAYDKFLKDAIVKSDLSLYQIEIQAKAKGVNIDKSYISKLQNRKKEPPSESINIVLAEILEVDKEEMLFEAYMEQAPDTIVKFLDEFHSFFMGTIYSMVEKTIPMDKRKEVRIGIMDKVKPFKIFKAVSDGELEMLNVIDNSTMMESIEDDTQIKVMMPSLFTHKMNDDSMYPLINKNDKLQIDCSIQHLVGDIVIAELKEEELVIRRYLEQNNNIVLRADNRNFKTETYDISEVKIIGKITSVTRDL